MVGSGLVVCEHTRSKMEGEGCFRRGTSALSTLCGMGEEISGDGLLGRDSDTDSITFGEKLNRCPTTGMLSMPGIQEFTPEFFQRASDVWRANKLSLPDSTFVYKCTECSTKVHSTETMKCWKHRGKKNVQPIQTEWGSVRRNNPGNPGC